jgi:hypothetical protein
MDTGFPMAIGPLASEAGAPPVASLRTIKSDVVVGIPSGVGEKLDEEEPGWKISGKYVSRLVLCHVFFPAEASLTIRPSCSCLPVDRVRHLNLPRRRNRSDLKYGRLHTNCDFAPSEIVSALIS